MKWKRMTVIPPLHVESGYGTSKRLLVWVSNTGKKGAIAFGWCIRHSPGDVCWYAEGYSGFAISHWRDLPEPPKW